MTALELQNKTTLRNCMSACHPVRSIQICHSIWISARAENRPWRVSFTGGVHFLLTIEWLARFFTEKTGINLKSEIEETSLGKVNCAHWSASIYPRMLKKHILARIGGPPASFVRASFERVLVRMVERRIDSVAVDWHDRSWSQTWTRSWK